MSKVHTVCMVENDHTNALIPIGLNFRIKIKVLLICKGHYYKITCTETDFSSKPKRSRGIGKFIFDILSHLWLLRSNFSVLVQTGGAWEAMKWEHRF